MTDRIVGKVFHCGDYVNTDVMSPGRFEPYESTEQLARIALIDYEGKEPFVNPEKGVSDFSVIVAGREFGCGSSRETAPQAISYAGVKAVIARSFARIFFRNCVNMGLVLPIQVNHDFDEGVHGKAASIDPDRRTLTIDGKTFTFPDFGPLARIVDAGGLTNYNKQKQKVRA
jgi:3-isopropylmalate/(R)-2-methylmalate dehydratase small subunit